MSAAVPYALTTENLLFILIFFALALVVLVLIRRTRAKETISERNVPVDQENMVYCRYCGNKNPSDTVFCEKCGKKVG